MDHRRCKRKLALRTAWACIASAALTGCGRVEINKAVMEGDATSSVIEAAESMSTLDTTAEPGLVTVLEAVTEAAETSGTEGSVSGKKSVTEKTKKAASKKSGKKSKTKKKTKKTATEPAAVIPETTTAAATTAETTTTTTTETTTTTVMTEGPLPLQIIPETTLPVTAAPESGTDETQQNELDGSEQTSGNRSHIININCLIQNPELPMGCEAVSLAMVFNYYGYSADKFSMANYYMPRADVYWENGTMYGPDYRYVFAGDPADPHAYGCLAPCMITTAQNYLNDAGGGMYPFDASGTAFEDLLTTYIDRDVPLLLWVTTGLATPYYSHVWVTPSGEQMQWITPEHCLVLTGYDLDNGLIYVADPMVGNTCYSYDLVKQRYNELGQQCMGLSR